MIAKKNPTIRDYNQWWRTSNQTSSSTLLLLIYAAHTLLQPSRYSPLVHGSPIRRVTVSCRMASGWPLLWCLRQSRITICRIPCFRGVNRHRYLQPFWVHVLTVSTNVCCTTMQQHVVCRLCVYGSDVHQLGESPVTRCSSSIGLFVSTGHLSSLFLQHLDWETWD